MIAKNKVIKIYGASGWFTPRTEQYISDLEKLFEGKEDIINFYSPRRDGTKLTPDQFHDHAMRERTFNDNITNILDSDFVLANIDGLDGKIDTGTIWEVGFAMAHGIPVFGATLDETGFEESKKLLGGMIDNFTMVYDKESINKIFNGTIEEIREELNYWIKTQGPKNVETTPRGKKVLVVGPTDTTENTEICKGIVSTVIENKTSKVKWIDNIYNPKLFEDMNKVFEDLEFMIAVIDSKNPIVSWMMGQAYGRGIPLVSYTDTDNTVNLMLLLSIKRHLKGKSELSEFLQLTKRVLIDEIEVADTSNIKAQ